MTATKGRKPAQRGPKPPRARAGSTGKAKTLGKNKRDITAGRARGPLGTRKQKTMAEHHVRSGETLSQIAQLYYGHGDREYVKTIQDANKDIIKDIDTIQAGQGIKIPTLPHILRNS